MSGDCDDNRQPGTAAAEAVVRFRCGACGKLLSARRGPVARLAGCPACGAKVKVPTASLPGPGPAAVRRSREPTIEVRPSANSAAAPLAPPVPPVPSSAQSPVGRVLGSEYLVEEFLGEGTDAQVYRGRHQRTGAVVALKILRARNLKPHRLIRFYREAHLLSRLRHPRILPVLAYGHDDGACWMAMEYEPAGDVGRHLARGRVRWRVAVRWLADVLAALKAVHRAGIIHRDVKPANLMLASDGGVRLSDFGMMKVLGAQASLTRCGRWLGSPAYMAPDEVFHGKTDSRADLYSVGATFYHILSGRMPFDAQEPQEMIRRHVQDTPVPLEQAAPHVPPALCRLIMRLMEKAVVLRFQTAESALTDLKGYELFGGFGVGAALPTPAAAEPPPEDSLDSSIKAIVARAGADQNIISPPPSLGPGDTSEEAPPEAGPTLNSPVSAASVAASDLVVRPSLGAGAPGSSAIAVSELPASGAASPVGAAGE